MAEVPPQRQMDAVPGLEQQRLLWPGPGLVVQQGWTARVSDDVKLSGYRQPAWV